MWGAKECLQSQREFVFMTVADSVFPRAKKDLVDSSAALLRMSSCPTVEIFHDRGQRMKMKALRLRGDPCSTGHSANCFSWPELGHLFRYVIRFWEQVCFHFTRWVKAHACPGAEGHLAAVPRRCFSSSGTTWECEPTESPDTVTLQSDHLPRVTLNLSALCVPKYPTNHCNFLLQ